MDRDELGPNVIAAWSQEALSISEYGLQVVFAGFLALWTFALGAVIGSFLNVVIYRLPRGMSLVHPKSRCPGCQAPVRATDNIPILSWLRLRGRCRTCRGPISARYPFIEGLVAVLVFGLAWVEIASGGFNLPGGFSRELATNPLLWRWETAAIVRFGYHAYLLVVAVAIGAIAWDGFRPPWSVVIFSLIVGLVVPVFVPEIWPVAGGIPRWLPVITLVPNWEIVVDANAVLVGFAGLAGGLLAGAALIAAASERCDRRGVLVLSMLAGLYLGWRALASYAPQAGGLALIVALVCRRRTAPVPVTVVCGAVLAIQVFAWRFLWQGISALADWAAVAGLEREFVPATALVLTLIFSGWARLAVAFRAATSSGNEAASDTAK